MIETSQTITVWASETFGEAESIKAYVLRAQDEMTELLESIDAKKPATEILSEVADVTILLHRVVGTLGLELSEVLTGKCRLTETVSGKNPAMVSGSINKVK